MKYRIFAVLMLSILVLNSFADTTAKKSNGSELVSLLPASDGVVILDAKRFFSDALPKILSNNQPMFAKVTGTIETFKTKTGIDVRQFNSVAAGSTVRQLGEKKYEIDPVIIARGQMSSASLIKGAKAASNGKFTEEKFGERTIYIFPGDAVANSTPIVGKLSEGVAVTIIDSTTIAFGTLARVRQTLEGKTKVGTDLSGLLTQNRAAVTSFATKVPGGMKAFLPLENDELGKNIDSIQYVYGNADVAAGSASVQVTARTLENAQATSLHETLEGLQILGKAFLGGSRSPDKQVYARLIENSKFSVRANEVMLDLTVPQSDIDILVSMLKK